MRKLYQLYTYALPAASVQWTIRAIEQVKALLRH
jgi:hypothetical protein